MKTTTQTRYTAQIKADRRQAALDRRNERVTELDERRQMYANVGN